MAGTESFSDDDDSDEEKFERERLLEDAEDGRSVTMSEDLEQLRNAAEVVGEIVTIEHLHQHQQQQQQYQSLPLALAHPAPSPAPIPIPVVEQVNINTSIISNTIPPIPHFEEELPAYEDNDGSDLSSIVSDGYRPGTLYTPSQSPNGSLSDILGPDRKS